MGRDIVERQPAFALGGVAAPDRDKSRQPPVTGAIDRPHDDGRCVDGRQFRPDEQLHACRLGRDVHADGAGQAVAIGDGNGAIAEFAGPRRQFIGVRRSLQKGKIRAAMKLGIWLRRCGRRLGNGTSFCRLMFRHG
jgi:hypothetical protein